MCNLTSSPGNRACSFALITKQVLTASRQQLLIFNIVERNIGPVSYIGHQLPETPAGVALLEFSK